jgi:SAM-dependent methyltransferase
VTAADRARWDARWADVADAAGPADRAPTFPEVFAAAARWFPRTGRALELACGTGEAAIAAALEGLDVTGVDISPVAVAAARRRARAWYVETSCRFGVWDLDGGLPAGPEVDLLLCHRFRDSRLYPAMAARLAPGGVLAIAVLSEVGGEPGPFRAGHGELAAAFGDLDQLDGGEGAGVAWLVAVRPRR